MAPKITVCIPAYNRAELLPPLLDSILAQDFDDYDILICEDASPERAAIRAVANDYMARRPGRLRYVENSSNLGYDGNLRHLVAAAAGEYCLFMGNDDLMCAGALRIVADALQRHSNVGVLVRAYADFDGTPDHINQTFRYFPDERFFPAGANSIATVFRRSVVISGMTIQRDAARSFSTDRWDGSLLYQLWLVANILVEKNAVYLPDILVLRRNGIPPDFGQAEAERGRFVPQNQTPESSVHFMRGMLDIALRVEQRRHVRIYRPILADIAHYGYPILSIQANQPFTVFVRYWWRLAALGLGRYPIFHAYFLALLLLGAPRLDRLIGQIKRSLGHTPNLGRLFRGRQP